MFDYEGLPYNCPVCYGELPFIWVERDLMRLAEGLREIRRDMLEPKHMKGDVLLACTTCLRWKLEIHHRAGDRGTESFYVRAIDKFVSHATYIHYQFFSPESTYFRLSRKDKIVSCRANYWVEPLRLYEGLIS